MPRLVASSWCGRVFCSGVGLLPRAVAWMRGRQAALALARVRPTLLVLALLFTPSVAQPADVGPQDIFFSHSQTSDSTRTVFQYDRNAAATSPVFQAADMLRLLAADANGSILFNHTNATATVFRYDPDRGETETLFQAPDFLMTLSADASGGSSAGGARGRASRLLPCRRARRGRRRGARAPASRARRTPRSARCDA